MSATCPMASVFGREVAPGDGPGIAGFAVRFEALHRGRGKAHMHDKVRQRDRRHGEQIGLDLDHVLDRARPFQDVVRQNAILAGHVDVPHRPAGAELQDGVDVVHQHRRLSPDGITDRLQGKKEKEGDGDQHGDQTQSQLAP